MTLSKQRLRALGLCLIAALGLIAFVAASAQAQTGWLVNKAFITKNTPITATLHTGSEAILSSTFGTPEKTIELLCETVSSTNGNIFSGAAAEGLIFLQFTKCRTLINKVVSPACKPKEPIVWGSKFHAILHTTGDKKTYILFEPDVAGKPFATIEFGEECSFGTTAAGGEFVMECLNEKLEKNTATTDYCLEDLTNHLWQEVAKKELFPLTGEAGKFDELKFGTRPASLNGIFKTFITAGGTWAVHI